MKCYIDGVFFQDQLVCCLQLCTSRYLERDEEAPEIIDKVQETLSSLVTRMISSELEDFELNRSSDFSTSSVGQKNRLFAQLAMGTYEVKCEILHANLVVRLNLKSCVQP